MSHPHVRGRATLAALLTLVAWPGAGRAQAAEPGVTPREVQAAAAPLRLLAGSSRAHAAAAPTAGRSVPGTGPDAVSVTGTVTESGGRGVPQVEVRLVELGRSTLTNDQGRYTLAQVPAGTYTLSFDALGYKPLVQRITVGDADLTENASLTPSAIEVPGLQVSASAVATSALNSPQPVSIVSGDQLARQRDTNLGAALADIPGVHNNSSGPAAGKPVIRGLTNSRVLVVDDGQRLEHNQWGDDHFTSVEPAAASHIEVIRGPASVLYGSDALGGVINVIEPDLPDAIGQTPFARGTVSGGFASNNSQPDGTLELEGANGGFGFRVSGTGRTAKDVKTPDYTLWNSGYHNVGGEGTLGYRGTWGSLKGAYTMRRDRLQLTDEDPTADGFARTDDDRGHLDLDVPVGGARLTWNAGYEVNRRKEFEEATATDPSFFMEQKTFNTEARLHHASGALSGVLGAAAEFSNDDNHGEEHLAPDSRSSFVGLYAFEQTDAGRWNLSFGARFDHRHLNAVADPDLGNGAASLSWNAVTGNVGALYHVSEPVALVLNLGRGFRAPSVFDLFANGLHEATSTFEHGNPDLKTETSFNTDLALRVQSSSARAEIGGFVNRIQNFVYTVPSNQIDPGSGFEIYNVTQGDAVLSGFEAQVEYHPTAVVHLQGTADYVHGQNTDIAQPLPSIPPLRATYEVRFEGRALGQLSSPYFSVGGESNARQDRLNPEEAAFFASSLDGVGYHPSAYTLVNAGAGFSLSAGSGNTVRIDLELRNALDTTWADFLSHLKTNAPNPGMGRNLTMRFTVDF
jgi:iron complex outermembrane recepter protein